MLDLAVHGYPLLCLLLDYFFNVIPFIAKHMFVTLGIGACYFAVNIGKNSVYSVYTQTVEQIYPIIDYKTVMSYVYVIGIFAVVAITHGLCQLIWIKCKKPRYVKFLEAQKAEQNNP